MRQGWGERTDVGDRRQAILSTIDPGDAMVAGIAATLLEGAPLERLAGLAVAFATS